MDKMNILIAEGERMIEETDFISDLAALPEHDDGFPEVGEIVLVRNLEETMREIESGEREFDILFTDLDLLASANASHSVETAGFDIIKAVRIKMPECCIVLMTHNLTNTVIIQAQESAGGNIDFLIKPFAWWLFEQKLRSIISIIAGK